jgi:hypothetical protein
MACQMRRDPTGIHTFLAPTGSTLTMCFESASGLAHLTAANLNRTPIPVNDPCVTFTIIRGSNLLLITMVSPDPNDTIKVFEDCGDGTKNKLEEYAFDPQDPVRGYVIIGQ